MPASIEAAVFNAGRSAILYDGQRLPAVSAEWLMPDFWRQRGAVFAEFGGRGQALGVDTEVGRAVLRPYWRGGLVRHLVNQHYLFTGVERSRPFREWRLLDALQAKGLPVPRPIMAACFTVGPFYRAALMTDWVVDAKPLAMLAAELETEEWQSVADTLTLFFQAGLCHPDLNANNLLRCASGQWYLIDLDRARLLAGNVPRQAMVARLVRSLGRVAPGVSPTPLLQAMEARASRETPEPD